MEKRRLDELDLAKGIGIILVVTAHSTFTSLSVQAYITAFHMPLFFIISGILMCYTDKEEKRLSAVAKKKAGTILIPYVTFSAANLLIDLAVMYLKPGQMTWADIRIACIEFYTFYGISVLWFMSSLFFGEMLFLCLKKRCGCWRYGDAVMIVSGIIAAVILIVVSPMVPKLLSDEQKYAASLGDYYMTVIMRSIGAFSFIVIGYYGYRYIFMHLKKSEAFSWKEAACGVLCLLLTGVVGCENGIVDFRFLVFGNPLLYYLGASAGTFGVVLLCRQIVGVRWVNRPLRYLGVNSLIIMATHLDFRVLNIAIRFAGWVSQYVTFADVYMLYLNVALMMTLIEVVLIYCINHFLPFMIGRRRQKLP